jgi:hypothetical protein
MDRSVVSRRLDAGDGQHEEKSMVTNNPQAGPHCGAHPAARATRTQLVEAVAIAATAYRHLMARYNAGQAALMDEGVGLDELVTGTWEQFEAVAAAEARLFALVDALDDAGGLQIVRGGEEHAE